MSTIALVICVLSSPSQHQHQPSQWWHSFISFRCFHSVITIQPLLQRGAVLRGLRSWKINDTPPPDSANSFLLTPAPLLTPDIGKSRSPSVKLLLTAVLVSTQEKGKLYSARVLCHVSGDCTRVTCLAVNVILFIRHMNSISLYILCHLIRGE